MEELNICTLFIQTSLPPNHPTSLKVKNVHNFAILKRICMKFCMESLNGKTQGMHTIYPNQLTTQPPYLPKSKKRA